MEKETSMLYKNLSKSLCIQFDYYLLKYKFTQYSLESIVHVNNTHVKTVKSSKLSKIFHFLYKSSNFVILLCNSLKLIISDHSLWLYVIGDIATFLDGKRYFYNIPFLLYTILSCYVIYMFQFDPKPKWMTRFAHLQGIVPPIRNGIRSFGIVKKEIRRFKLTLPLFSFVVQATVVSGIASFLAVLSLNISLNHYLYWIYALIWTIYYPGLYLFASTGYNLITIGYFHLLCYHYQLRLNHINQELDKLKTNVNSMKRNEKNCLSRCLVQIKIIANSVKIDNQLWNRLIGVNYFLLIAIIGFDLNIILYYEINYISLAYSIIMLIVCIFYLLLISISAARVNSQFKIIANRLMKILIHKNINVYQKIKVHDFLH